MRLATMREMAKVNLSCMALFYQNHEPPVNCMTCNYVYLTLDRDIDIQPILRLEVPARESFFICEHGQQL